MSRRPAVRATAATCALVCALLAPAAEAQDRFSVSLGYGVSWDDNVFRLPESAPDPELNRGNSGKSDRYSTASVGLSLNLPIAMQRFLVDVTRAAIRYEKFSSQDQDPFSYRGAWQWQLTPRFSGVLSASRAEIAVNVEDVAGRRRIDQRTTAYAATADAWIMGGWHLLGAASDTETVYDEPFLARPDTTEKTAEASLRYIAGSNSQVTATRRWTRGTETVTDAALFGGSDFTVDAYELSATWIASAHSTVHARATRIERRNEVLPQRDFSGTTGELRYAWRPTAKLTVDLSGARDITPFNISLDSTTRVDDTVAAAVVWAIGERTSLQSRVSREKSRFGEVSTLTEARRDATDAIEVGARWAPHRSITLDARLRHEERTSTDPFQVFDSNVASIAVAFRF
jgi:exopolysaccharide biosynthesis operon protein EpsL